MNMSTATNAQLKEIAYHDKEAHWVYKAAAEAELMRRQNPKRYIRINYKQKPLYR